MLYVAWKRGFPRKGARFGPLKCWWFMAKKKKKNRCDISSLSISLLHVLPQTTLFFHKLCPQYRFRVYMFYLREGCCCWCRWCLEGLNVRPLGHLHYSPGWAALSSTQADAFTSAIWTIIAAYPSSVWYTSRSELFAPDSSWWRTDDAVPSAARFHSRVQPELSSETFCQCQWLPCPKYSPEDCSGLKGRRFWRCWLLNMSTVLLVLS